MTYRSRIWLATAFVVGCGGESGGGGSAATAEALPPFCREALASVEAFMSSAADSREGDPRAGGIVVVGVISEMNGGMNAFGAAEHAAQQHQTFVNLMTLIRFDESFEPAPYLADRWEQSEDGRELTFFLRDDVLWHDGTPTTAHDVAFTFRRASDPETQFPNSGFWTPYRSVEVVDDHTIRFEVEPSLNLLDPWRAMAIMPAHLLEDVPAAELGAHPYGEECPVGNGPFVYAGRSAGDQWSFTSNPAFPEGLGGPPLVDRYVYRVIPDQNTLMSELLAGGIDVYIQPSTEQSRRIEQVDELELLAFPFRSYAMVIWNTRLPTLSDKRVRQAITHATNRAEMLEVLRGGYGTLANATVPPFHPHYDPAIESAMPYNPGRAETLLTQAGWVDRNGDGIRENQAGDPLRITISYNTGNDERRGIAEVMQSQLGHVGIDVRVEAADFNALIERAMSPEREFDGVTLAWNSEFFVDDTNLFHSSQVDEGFGFSGTQRADVDRLIEAIAAAPDQETLGPLLREYQQVVIDEQPFTFLYYGDRTVGVNERMRDVEMDARGEWVSIHEWWIDPERRRNVTDG